MLLSELSTISWHPSHFSSRCSMWLLRSALAPFWVQFLLPLLREALLRTSHEALCQQGPSQDAPWEARTPDLEVNSLTL